MNFNYFVCHTCIMRGKGFDGSKFKLLWVFFLLIYLAVFYCMLVFLDCDAKIIK